MSLGALTIYQRGIRARNALWASFFLLGFASRAIFVVAVQVKYIKVRELN
ncbi:hypothetical protein [Candidatus Planktophila versatilis]|nr:hypothetical protein [Candidatus Planktophila versatilis]